MNASVEPVGARAASAARESAGDVLTLFATPFCICIKSNLIIVESILIGHIYILTVVEL